MSKDLSRHWPAPVKIQNPATGSDDSVHLRNKTRNWDSLYIEVRTWYICPDFVDTHPPYTDKRPCMHTFSIVCFFFKYFFFSKKYSNLVPYCVQKLSADDKKFH